MPTRVRKLPVKHSVAHDVAVDETVRSWRANTAADPVPTQVPNVMQAIARTGVDVLTVSRRLGHGSPAITLSIYGHLFANTDDRAAKILEATFASVRTE